MISNRFLRTALPVAALALTAPLFVGCSSSSGGDSKASFCDTYQSLAKDDSLSGFDASDPKAAVEQLNKMNDKIKNVEAPAEIKDEFGRVKKFLGDFSAAVKDIDPSDPTAFAKAVTDNSDLASEASTFSADGKKIDDYVSKNCG